MERLTEWRNGHGALLRGDGYTRLAQYEDTGLSPEDLKDFYPMLREFNQNLGALRHVHELVKAEHDGRLVMLPCQVGSSVYTIKEDFFNCDECEYGAESHYDPKIMRRCCDMDNHNHCPLKIVEHTVGGFEVSSGLHREPKVSSPGEWGYEGLEEFRGYDYKWYLTREEAEAALKGAANAD